MKKTLILAILSIVAFGANGAWADGPFPTNMTDGTYGPAGSVTPNSNTNEFEIYNAVNLLLNTSYTSNAQIDSLEDTGNTSTWQQTSNTGYSVIGLGAANANTLEVYNSSTPGTLINPLGTSFSGNGPTGNGTNASPYQGTATSVFPLGTQFGIAINSVGETNLNGTTAGTSTWYSDPSLNSDGMNHMMVYNLSSLTGTQIEIVDPNTGTEEAITLEDPYLVAFEDLPLNDNGVNSDQDYNDLMVLVNGASPIAAVPEPMTVALFGLGLLSMAGFAFRRKFGLVF